MQNKTTKILIFVLVPILVVVLGLWYKVKDLGAQLTNLQTISASQKINEIQDFISDFLFNTKSSTIQIQAKRGGGAAGVLLSSDGYILTNKHVLDQDETYTIVYKDKSYPINSIDYISGYDLAIIKSSIQDNYYRPFKFAYDDLVVGNIIFSFGNSLNTYHQHLSMGIISAIDSTLELPFDLIYTGLYQADIAVHPGNSGGPVLDIYGNLVGIMTATTKGDDHIGFIIPISKDLISILSSRYPFLKQ